MVEFCILASTSLVPLMSVPTNDDPISRMSSIAVSRRFVPTQEECVRNESAICAPRRSALSKMAPTPFTTNLSVAPCMLAPPKSARVRSEPVRSALSRLAPTSEAPLRLAEMKLACPRRAPSSAAPLRSTPVKVERRRSSPRRSARRRCSSGEPTQCEKSDPAPCTYCRQMDGGGEGGKEGGGDGGSTGGRGGGGGCRGDGERGGDGLGATGGRKGGGWGGGVSGIGWAGGTGGGGVGGSNGTVKETALNWPGRDQPRLCVSASFGCGKVTTCPRPVHVAPFQPSP
mmetsp:Transcript_39892/g.129136  ORF Transcript_39892/g.129136 Transcript_39892/m.129136 type:complete len:286 (-) Transcript_39892:657-1514(-)